MAFSVSGWKWSGFLVSQDDALAKWTWPIIYRRPPWQARLPRMSPWGCGSKTAKITSV